VRHRSRPFLPFHCHYSTRGGRPKSGRVTICANVLPATAATLRAKAKALAKATGNRRPQLGAAIEHFVNPPAA
jgi:hypothetical protein